MRANSSVARAPTNTRLAVYAVVGIVSALCATGSVQAQAGTLAGPFAPPAPNAALHYQRALLIMSDLDEADLRYVEKDLWEVLPEAPSNRFPNELKRLLYRARHATAAAGKGARLESCDFGIDFSDRGAATILPHVQPMVELGRLLTLRGAYEESQGRWDEAAVIYFDGLRMGRHMARQRTLLEAMAGMQIQENNQFALARWAARCPDSDRVSRAFGLSEIICDDLIAPARTLASETSILALDYARLNAAFPNGPWGTTILESLGEEATEDEQQNRKKAVAACVKAGVPKEVFDDVRSFRKHLAGLKELDVRFAEAAAACMKLPPQARVDRGQRLYDRYIKAAGAIGEQTLLNPAEIGALFAGHEANTVVLRCSLALAARRTDKGFPKKLDAIAGGFGGAVPTSPYDGSPLVYEVIDNGRSFRLGVKEVQVGAVTLPQVEFTGAAPASADES